ncbi:MAG: glycosyltransferase family 2 protein [Planctomycetaceae bacterium]|nr:glycosyltransferase family 2 protein [Planctomycetaceae bacterium]MCA9085976.1 glycosyltransferase family 2 protein [Planctomycetaceae bacterium]
MIIPVTVVIATRNEAANLKRCLDSLTEFERVIVVDSHSTDRTCEIADEGGAEVVQFVRTASYPKKRQWALENLSIATPWVLLLDADEVVPLKLKDEIREVCTADESHDGYLIRKGFHFLGRRFRFGGFSHQAVLLFRQGKAKFEHVLDDDPSGMDMEVHERLIVDGTVGQLHTPLIHEDFKGLTAYIQKHNQYSDWEAAIRCRFMQTGHWGRETIRPNLFGNIQERRRFLKQILVHLPLEHWIWFLTHYFVFLGCLEGRPGLIACRLRSQYIADVKAKMYEMNRDS